MALQQSLQSGRRTEDDQQHSNIVHFRSERMSQSGRNVRIASDNLRLSIDIRDDAKRTERNCWFPERALRRSAARHSQAFAGLQSGQSVAHLYHWLRRSAVVRSRHQCRFVSISAIAAGIVATLECCVLYFDANAPVTSLRKFVLLMCVC